MRHWEARKHDDCNWTKPWQHRRQTTQPTIIIASFGGKKNPPYLIRPRQATDFHYGIRTPILDSTTTKTQQEIIRAKIYTKVESEIEAVIMKREDKLHELKERHDKMG